MLNSNVNKSLIESIETIEDPLASAPHWLLVSVLKTVFKYCWGSISKCNGVHLLVVSLRIHIVVIAFFTF